MFKKLAALWLLPIFSFSGYAAAQIPASPSQVANTSTASSPPYQSAFEGYQPYAEEKIANWKSANDTVERVGGWREYAKQAQQPANTPAQSMKPGEAAPKAKP